MSSVRRSKAAKTPEWAARLDDDQFAEFCEHVRQALAPHGGGRMGEGFVTVSGHATRYGLTNLLQQWALSEPAARPDLVALHFHNLFEAQASAPPSTDALLGSIRPRVRNRDYPGAVTVPSISQTIADGVDAVLCVDLPTAVSNLTAEQHALTGRTTPELWELAISQIDDGLPVHEETLGDGVTAFAGDSFFVASRVLDLERFAGPVPPSGALVAIPHRHMMLVHPIETTRALTALNTMIGAADHFFRQGPGSIVPYVFWLRHDRALMRIPSGIRDGHHFLIPPDEFMGCLNALPGPADG